MSFRNCIPSKWMDSTPSYARRIANSSVGAVAVAAMTRPPEVLSAEVGDAAVPAWKIVTSGG
jgi:hypothetical protein